ncbi:MAG: dipeptide ABC transporter ATP-binding protein [Pseudomonadota bacterium]
MAAPVLDIKNLDLQIGQKPILDQVNLTVRAVEVHAIVGESGSGKSITALATMGLLPAQARTSGQILFEGQDILGLPDRQMCKLRGDDLGMVFQEPMTALNPVKTIGDQVAEGISWHTGVLRINAEKQARQILERVGLPPDQFSPDRYPHELSGGQRQRVVIAIACALKPKLLIADEPTTALDVVLQRQILDLLRSLVKENNMGLVLISHDLGVVADMADDITVLRDGKICETGPAVDILHHQHHPYTRQLAEASVHAPAWAGKNSETSQTPLLVLNEVVKDYPGKRVGVFARKTPFRAVDHVGFAIPEGRSVGLVGRSGCGKSTLARMILALDKPTSGSISLHGINTNEARGEQMQALRRDMQVVFQDPQGSFNPRRTVEWLVSEPLHIVPDAPSGAARRDRVAEALKEVGMPPDAMRRYPHEFSGGQRQRLAIARAIITRPKLVVADEPVSALDVSIRAQILDLFAALNDQLKIAFLFITHDLTVARTITHELMVMDAGKIVEHGPSASVLDSPKSGPAQALVEAAPNLHRSIEMRRAASA